MGFSSIPVILATAASLTSALVVPASADVHHIDISSRSLKYDGLSPASAFLTSLEDTLVKYNVHRSAHAISESKKRALTEEALTDDGQDTQYSGNVKVNSQTFSVDFDTGSSNLWVPGSGCVGCPGTIRYNDKGKSLMKTVALSYGSGAVQGPEYSDTVSIGSLSASNVTLVSVKKAQGFKKSQSDGLMGLAFKQLAKGGASTFVGELIAQEKLSVPEFSFFLGRKASGTGSKSQLTFGGADSSLYSGSFTKVPVTKQGYWQVATDGLYVDGKQVAGTAGQGAIDTGTTIIVADLTEVKAAASSIQGGKSVEIAQGEFAFAFPCSQQSTTVAFGFGGKQFAINAKDLVIAKGTITQDFLNQIRNDRNEETIGQIFKEIEQDATEYCVTALAGVQGLGKETGGLSYIIGDTFLKNWYTTFSHADPPSVSFATAKLNQ